MSAGVQAPHGNDVVHDGCDLSSRKVRKACAQSMWAIHHVCVSQGTHKGKTRAAPHSTARRPDELVSLSASNRSSQNLNPTSFLLLLLSFVLLLLFLQPSRRASQFALSHNYDCWGGICAKHAPTRPRAHHPQEHSTIMQSSWEYYRSRHVQPDRDNKS